MENLFSKLHDDKKPLAERMRPKTLTEFYGQKHILSENKPLYRLIKAGKVPNCIFWGPPGTGKTTLANLIASAEGSYFEKLNAASSGIAEAKVIQEKAKQNFMITGKRTYFLLDECHRWNKTQSDSMLGAMEEGYIVFIGSTTENPSFSMTRAIVSRCNVFEFKPLIESDIFDILKTALYNKRGLGDLKIKATDEALTYIARASHGDSRTALNSLEVAALSTTRASDEFVHIEVNDARESMIQKTFTLNENDYYHILSAFCKSLRGSDADAALYYANLLLNSGVDPLTICRRVICHASEDVGMADSNALVVAVNALIAIQNLGMPEANLPLSHAIIYVCEAPKSNSVCIAKDAAIADIQNFADLNVPLYLRNHTKESENYMYPHLYGGYIKQQYLPDTYKDAIYYKPLNNGYEKGYKRKKIY